ncbi:MAG: cob(I)yrinic acid a,c-diamide adenosyltransferase [Clostridiales bacterium]|nr:cob(I)yrinic acid a,c-diamide adenosyltransferase [Clostridiales bacterium]
MSQREVFMTMESGMIQAFYGTGKGKTSAAVGQALRELQHGQRITMIQFLKGKVADEFQVLERLEPDVQIFRFDKSEENYCDLSESEKEEEKANILNGFNFSKKVLETGESDVIILDELLGLIDLGILTEDDVEDLLRIQGDYHKLIITGTKLPEQIRAYVDEVSEIL